MQFDKREISRAVEECNECMTNIINADSENYIFRLKQFFTKVDKNNVLSFIIKPYLFLQLDETKVGFVNMHHAKWDFVLPEDDDEEISVILKTLYEMKDNEDSIISVPHTLYLQDHIEEDINLFNANLIGPAFNKLARKLRYKIEDLQLIEENTIDSSKITIINIGNITATNSTIGVGEHINQTLKKNVFAEIQNEIEKNIENKKERDLLVTLLSEMENEKNNKEKFREK